MCAAMLRDDDFRELFDHAPGPYLILAPDLTIVGVNHAYLRATLTRREDIVGRALFEVFPDNPADTGATGVRNLSASLQRVLSLRQPDTMAVQKYDIRRPDGSFEERYWSPLNSPVFDKTGKIKFIIHHVQDVTEYVLARKNPAASEETNALRDKAERLEMEVYLRAQELQTANERLRKANEEIAASQAKLMQRQRLEAIGQLTGGVAHDFNNLLTAILGNLDVMERSFDSGDPHQPFIHAAQRAATRGARLTQQLLAFGRRQALRLETLSINSLLKEFVPFMRRALGENIELHMDLNPSPCTSAVDAAQLQAAMLNITLNARDAMPQGGRLSIETRCEEHGPADSLNGDEWKPGRYVAIRVRDTGVGMAPEVRARASNRFSQPKMWGKARASDSAKSTALSTKRAATCFWTAPKAAERQSPSICRKPRRSRRRRHPRRRGAALTFRKRPRPFWSSRTTMMCADR